MLIKLCSPHTTSYFYITIYSIFCPEVFRTPAHLDSWAISCQARARQSTHPIRGAVLILIHSGICPNIGPLGPNNGDNHRPAVDFECFIEIHIYIYICNQVFQCNKEQVSALINIDLKPNPGFLKSADCSTLRTLVEMSFF